MRIHAPIKILGNLTVLALGPLTNLALAVRIGPEIKTSLKSIYCMGGNVEGRQYYNFTT